MIKQRQLIATLTALTIVVSMVSFMACNKKNEIANNTKNADIVSITSDNDLESYLLDLRKRMKSAVRNGESMSLNDAEWNLTALENFGLCDGSKRSCEMIIDTFYTKVKTVEGNISLYDLNLAYEINKKHIVERFNSLAEDDKNIYCIKCSIEDLSKNDSVEIKTITHMRNGGGEPNDRRFGSTDYWYDFNLRGKCGAYEGQCIGRDATTELKTKIELNIPPQACNGRIYYTNIQDYCVNYQDANYINGGECSDSPYPPDCLYTNWTYYNRCLSPDELNWYLDMILDIVNIAESTYHKNAIEFDVFPGGWIGTHSYPPNYETDYEFWNVCIVLADVNCTQLPCDL